MINTGTVSAASPNGRKKCGIKTTVWSRVCGYHRPVSNWNRGKQEEFKDRKAFGAPAPSPSSGHVKRRTAINGGMAHVAA